MGDRQVTAMDGWHRDGTGSRLQELRTPTFVAAGTEDIVIPSSNALTLVNATPGAWLARFKEGGHAFMAQYPTAAGGSHQRVPRPLIERRLSQSQDAIQDAYRVHAFQRLRIGFA